MNILLINPPNCGRSIPEEEYGISSLKLIFRGEPLSLEVLAANLEECNVALVDLKVEPHGLENMDVEPDLIGFTGLTCEARTICRLAGEMRKRFPKSVIVVGGHHASLDPEFFNRAEFDYVVTGVGKLSFRLLIDALREGETPAISGVAVTNPGFALNFTKRSFTEADLVDEKVPRYDLVAANREHYVMSGAGGKVGFVVTSYGCTHACAFCSIPSMTGGKYLSHSVDAILRDMDALSDLPLIRFVDANTFGDLATAKILAERLLEKENKQKIVADVRADTVVQNPELMELWHRAGLVSVVIGFEEIEDSRLVLMNKRSSFATNAGALELLAEIGIKVIGDFIISPDYTHEDFDRLETFIAQAPIALPVPSILTPLPGTPLYKRVKDKLKITDLDYYTFTNAVLPTTLPEKEFYGRYAHLMQAVHSHLIEQKK